MIRAFLTDLITIIALITFVTGAMCLASAAVAPLSHVQHQEN